jgi:hypothetical protein
MKTVLDTTTSWLWFPAIAEYKNRELRLVLEEGAIQNQLQSVEVAPGAILENLRAIEVSQTSRRVEVHFTDVRLIQIYDEVAHKAHPAETRDSGIVAMHHDSELVRWLCESTKLMHTIPGELFHYSVETAEDFYHVITREHPAVCEIDV